MANYVIGPDISMFRIFLKVSWVNDIENEKTKTIFSKHCATSNTLLSFVFRILYNVYKYIEYNNRNTLERSFPILAEYPQIWRTQRKYCLSVWYFDYSFYNKYLKR